MIAHVTSDAPGPERTRLNFADAVTRRFAFLTDLGFVQIEGTPTIVRYRKADIVANVCHGRQSYELSFEIQYGGSKYSMSELIRAYDPETAKQYRDFAARTQSALNEGLARLEGLVKRYGQEALRGDPDLFIALEKQGALWTKEFALDVRASQLRPKAEEAFRQRDWGQAAELYGQIEARLSPAEQKKLSIARQRGKAPS